MTSGSGTSVTGLQGSTIVSTIDHTAASYAYDPQGRLRLYVKYDQIATLADDIRTLLRE